MDLLGLRGIEASFVAEVIRDVLRGKPRSLEHDVAYVAARMIAAPRAEGLDLVPRRGPFVLVANHLELPGIWVGWVGVAITDAVARSREPGARCLHWVITSEWPWFQFLGRWVPFYPSSFLFPRASRVWGLIPTAADPSDVAGRAKSLRQILSCLGRPSHRASRERAEGEPVALFPEGRATVAIEAPRPGAGAFLHRLSALGVPLLPVGAFADSGKLVLRFGEPFAVGDPPPDEKEDLDRWAGAVVMTAIARLLPPDMRGIYSSGVSHAS